MLNRLRTFYCGFVVCGLLVCNKNPENATLGFDQKSYQEIIDKHAKLVENPTTINRKTTQNQWNCVLGAFSAPNRAQVGSRTLPLVGGTSPCGASWVQNGVQGSILEPQENRKSVQNRAFEHRLALRPSENGLWKGVRKKH